MELNLDCEGIEVFIASLHLVTGTYDNWGQNFLIIKIRWKWLKLNQDICFNLIADQWKIN